MRLALALLTIALAACSTPPNQMRDESPFVTFTSEHSTEVVFRRVTEGARNCFPKMKVDADYFPDNGSAQISVSNQLELIVASLMVTNISRLDGATLVRVAFLKGNPGLAKQVEAWSRGDPNDCRYGS